MNCPQCRSPLNGNGVCSRCSPARAAADEAGPALARANLLRIRGRWSEAAEQCAAILRAHPRCAAAHSLMGDVYQDQGRLEDARRWYYLALQIDPASAADRAKLARADEVLEARSQKAEWEAVIEGRTQPITTALLIRESLQRVAAVAGAGLCGIILVMATLVAATERTHAANDETPVQIGRAHV